LITLALPTTPPAPTPDNPNPPAGIYQLAGAVNDERVNDVMAAGGINSSPNTYLDLLKPFQDINIVAIPGNTNPSAQQALVTHCETLFNRFAILDGIYDTAADANAGYPLLLTQYGQVRTPNGFAAIYFPWIQVVNPLTGATEYWPPAGHVMGIYALTDQTRGVYKAPANVAIAGALGLQFQLTNADQGPLNLLGINILRVFPEQSQPLVWGARTTSTDSDWQYVSTRRLFTYLELSIEQGIRWAVFEPNNAMLWGSLKRTITEFLNRVQNDGGIISFYVRIDSTLNPPSTQALGQLYIEVGIQPAYPAEFIILRIGIWQGGSSVTES
jgi:phage tail sheath protein FI